MEKFHFEKSLRDLGKFFRKSLYFCSPESKTMDLSEYLELGDNFLTRAQSNPETFKNEVDLLKSRFWGWDTRSIPIPIDSDLKSIENTIGIWWKSLYKSNFHPSKRIRFLICDGVADICDGFRSATASQIRNPDF